MFWTVTPIQPGLIFACLGQSCAGHLFSNTTDRKACLVFMRERRHYCLKFWCLRFLQCSTPDNFRLFVLLQCEHLSKPSTVLHSKSKFSSMNLPEYVSIIVCCTIHHPLKLSGVDPSCCIHSHPVLKWMSWLSSFNTTLSVKASAFGSSVNDNRGKLELNPKSYWV